MPASIIGIGTALPSNSVTQLDAFSLAKDISCQTASHERVLEQVYKMSGVENRSTAIALAVEEAVSLNFYQPQISASDFGPSTAQRMVEYENQAGPLATQACREALNQSGIAASTITHLVTVSCTGFAAPGFDLHLFKSLSLNPSVKRTHVGFMGCHGALNAMRVANGLCSENPNNVVLLCSTELCSMHFQYGWSKDTVVANALFGDGAAALLMVSSKENVESANLRYSDSASYVIPGTESSMSWRIGDAGFILSLDSEVPAVIEVHLPGFMSSWLASNGLAVGDIRSWAVHPGGPRILDAVSTSLKLPQEALSCSRTILAECGNMSSPTVLFILQRLLAGGNKPPFVMLGFGPGLTVEAVLLI